MIDRHGDFKTVNLIALTKNLVMFDAHRISIKYVMKYF